MLKIFEGNYKIVLCWSFNILWWNIKFNLGKFGKIKLGVEEPIKKP